MSACQEDHVPASSLSLQYIETENPFGLIRLQERISSERERGGEGRRFGERTAVYSSSMPTMNSNSTRGSSALSLLLNSGIFFSISLTVLLDDPPAPAALPPPTPAPNEPPLSKITLSSMVASERGTYCDVARPPSLIRSPVRVREQSARDRVHLADKIVLRDRLPIVAL